MTSEVKQSIYRPEIDGLRAIAVSTVVVNHALPSALTGGFIGVDIFYVISGYLITSIIIKGLARDDFSFLNFYARRARRILPALAVMLLASTLVAAFLLPPRELASYGKSVVATAAFSSNFYFWRKSGYFAQDAHNVPLLHTWSLAIEEQYYLIFPIVLWALRRFGHMRWLIAIGIVASLVYSIVLARTDPMSAFFLLPTRAWELLFGAAIAYGLIPTVTNKPARELAALAGILSIAIGATCLRSTSYFPGESALLPCVGAMLIIISGDHRNKTLVERILTLRPVIFVGTISYSLYLWHWPIISFLHFYVDDFSVAVAIGSIAVSLVVATGSWWFVERRFHNHPSHAGAREIRLGDRSVVLAGLGVLTATVAVGAALAMLVSPAVVERIYPKEIADLNKVAYRVITPSACQDPKAAMSMPQCRLGPPGKTPTVALWGDSTADALKDGLLDVAAGHPFIRFILHSCPPILGTARIDDRPEYARFGTRCSKFNDDVIRTIAEHPEIETVIISGLFRMAYDIPGTPVRLVPERPRVDGGGDRLHEIAELIVQTVRKLEAAGKTVVLIGGMYAPENASAIELLRNAMKGEPAEATVKMPIYDAYSREINVFLKSNIGKRAIFVDPKELFCRTETGECRYVSGNTPLMLDSTHLTIEGARRLSRLIFAATPALRCYDPASGTACAP